MNFEFIFHQYRSLKYVPSVEEERDSIFEYVYFTNKLEGNKLTLAQVTSILAENKISGVDMPYYDILETKGVYNAVNHMLAAVLNKRELSIELMLELNWKILGTAWRDEFSFVSAKLAGQKTDEFKTIKNAIRITTPNGEKTYITPLSKPENVRENMLNLVKIINDSKANIFSKASFLAKEIWLHQPFIDGNKRTGRLLINFLTMKEGMPLFSFEDKAKNYNHLLVQQYVEGKENLVKEYLETRIMQEMEKRIEIINQIKPNKNKAKDFEMGL